VPKAVQKMPRRADLGSEARVGLFAILGVVCVLTILVTLTSPALFRGRYILRTKVSDAGGIRKGDSVAMRGVDIGRVQKFEIAKDGVEVFLEIEGAYKVPEDSKVEIQPGALFGGMIADVVPGTSETPARKNAVLPGERPPGLMDTASGIAASAQGVVSKVQKAVEGPTLENLEKSSAEVRSLLADVKSLTNDEHKQLLALTATLDHGAQAFDRIANGGSIDRSLSQVDATTASLEHTSATLSKTAESLQGVLDRLDRGEGTLGKMSRDPELYDDLKRTTDSLNALVEDIKKNPKRYVKLSLF
jgi:phospholipid/cholesterol/gamma-HCH transport system substrate-binding protein